MSNVRTINPPHHPDTDTYDPMLAAFNRGELHGMRQARNEYRRGFEDAVAVAFIFLALGAVLVTLGVWIFR